MAKKDRIFQFSYDAYRQIMASMTQVATILGRDPVTVDREELEICLIDIASLLSHAQVIDTAKDNTADDDASAEDDVKLLGVARQTMSSDRLASGVYGCDLDDILYYNYDYHMWNKEVFLGTKLKYTAHDRLLASEFKTLLESDPRYSARYELASIAVRVVPKFPGMGVVVQDPTPGNGTAILGAIVSRSKENGQLIPANNKWIGVRATGNVPDAASYAISSFCTRAQRDKFFMHAIKEAFIPGFNY